MNVELRHLRYFVAVAEELHFGRAAERLHMSQPPLSMQIRALEDSIGAPLLERSRRRVTLTKAGEVFLREAREILARTTTAVGAARRAGQGEIGELTIGFISTADYNVLPPMLREFRNRVPGVRLALREATTDVQLESLLSGTIDVGFVLPPVDLPGIAYRAVHREPLVLALPETHAAAARPGRVRLARFADAPFVLFPRPLAPGLYDDIVSYCRRAGFSPRVEQEAVQMQTIISLVSAELGVALIPASMQNLRRTGVVYKSLVEPGPLTELGIAWRQDDPLATLGLFLELVASRAPSLPAESRNASQRH
ncbi:MAG: LysR family transcriptional regulator [Betaproteobacteria bacterium]|nr:LysR family transcriptional regulator [Betaproteobacteria bacterium]